MFAKSKIDDKLTPQQHRVILSNTDLFAKESKPSIIPIAPLELNFKHRISFVEQSVSSARLHDSHLSNRIASRKSTNANLNISNHDFGLTVASTRLNLSSNVSLTSPVEIAASPRVIHKAEPFELLQNQLNLTQDLKQMELKQDDTFKILKRRLWSKSKDFSSKRPVTNLVDSSAEVNFTAFLNNL